MEEINAEGLISDYYGDAVISQPHYGDVVISLPKPPNEELFNNSQKIKLPKTFLKVILKSFPEFRDVKSVGYREHAQYDPYDFNPIYRYLVGIDIYFNEPNGDKKPKGDYESLINDYFKMTYHDMDYITFKVQSLIIPPEKTNRDKFFELFGDE